MKPQNLGKGAKQTILVCILVFLILINTAAALGIRPAKTELTFQPSLNRSFSIWVVNTEGREHNLSLWAEGELAPFIRLDGENLHLSADQAETTFSFTLTLPEQLEPGTWEGRIVVLENITQGEGMRARVKLAHKVFLNVPGPFKAVQAELWVEETPEQFDLVTEVENTGNQPIQAVRSEFGIYEWAGPVLSLESEEKDLDVQEQVNLTSSVDKTQLREGEYEVRALVIYDEYQLKLADRFRLGEPAVEILDSSRLLAAGQINPVVTRARSDWNQPLNGTVEWVLLKDSKELARSGLLQFRLMPRRVQELTGHLDARGLEPGVYNLVTELEYDGWSTKASFPVDITAKPLIRTPVGTFELGLFEIGIILALIVIIIALLALLKT